VIFLIVDLDHAGRLCLHHIGFAWWSLIYFYAEQDILVKFFLNTAESSKRINLFGCTEHVITCMLITNLSFSESAHKSRNKVLNIKNFVLWHHAEATALILTTQANLLQRKRRVSCLQNVKFKTHDYRKFKCFWSSHIFCASLLGFFQILNFDLACFMWRRAGYPIAVLM